MICDTPGILPARRCNSDCGKPLRWGCAGVCAIIRGSRYSPQNRLPAHAINTRLSAGGRIFRGLQTGRHLHRDHRPHGHHAAGAARPLDIHPAGRAHLPDLDRTGARAGGVTLALRNSLFLIWKPTLLNWAMAAVCLGSLYIGEKPLIQRLLQSAVELSKAQWRQLTVIWGIFFAVAGAANIFVAYRFGESAWVNFKLFGLLGMTLAFMVIQGIWLAIMVSRNERESTSGAE